MQDIYPADFAIALVCENIPEFFVCTEAILCDLLIALNKLVQGNFCFLEMMPWRTGTIWLWPWSWPNEG